MSKEKKLSQQSEVTPARAHEVVSGSGAGHCKNSATNLLPWCCLLPCTVMPAAMHSDALPNWGKPAAAAGCQRFRHWVVIFHHFLSAWRRIAASWPPGPYQPASTLTWQFLIHAGTTTKLLHWIDLINCLILVDYSYYLSMWVVHNWTYIEPILTVCRSHKNASTLRSYSYCFDLWT